MQDHGGYRFRQTSDTVLEISPLDSDVGTIGHLCAPTDEFDCLQFPQFEFALPAQFRDDLGEWRHGGHSFKVVSPLSVKESPRDTFIIDGRCITRGPGCSFDYQFVYSLSSGLEVVPFIPIREC